MGRLNTEFRKGTKFDGSGKDINDQTSGDRKEAKRERFDGVSTPQTIGGIAKDMEQITSEIKENYNKMITILDNNSLIIKSIKEDLEDIKENYL